MPATFEHRVVTIGVGPDFGIAISGDKVMSGPNIMTIKTKMSEFLYNQLKYYTKRNK